MRLFVVIFVLLNCTWTHAAEGEVERTFYHLSLRSSLAGKASEDTVLIFTNRIRDEYGYDVTCDTFGWSGMNERDCIIALKKLIDLLFAGRVPPNTELLGINKIEFYAENKWKAQNETWTKLNVFIPYEADEDSIERIIKYNLDNPRRAGQRQVVLTMEKNLKDAEKNLKIDVEVQADLTPAQLTHGYALLVQAIKRIKEQKKEQNLQDPLVEVVLLGTRDLPLYEYRKKMKVGLNVNRSVAHATRFLLEQSAYFKKEGPNMISDLNINKWLSVQRFLSEREKLNATLKKLHEKHPTIEILCGAAGELTVKECYQAVESLDNALDMVPASSRRNINSVIIHNIRWWYALASFAENEDGFETLRAYYTTNSETMAEALIKPDVVQRFSRGAP